MALLPSHLANIFSLWKSINAEALTAAVSRKVALVTPQMSALDRKNCRLTNQVDKNEFKCLFSSHHSRLQSPKSRYCWLPVVVSQGNHLRSTSQILPSCSSIHARDSHTPHADNTHRSHHTNTMLYLSRPLRRDWRGAMWL